MSAPQKNQYKIKNTKLYWACNSVYFYETELWVKAECYANQLLTDRNGVSYWYFQRSDIWNYNEIFIQTNDWHRPLLGMSYLIDTASVHSGLTDLRHWLIDVIYVHKRKDKIKKFSNLQMNTLYLIHILNWIIIIIIL